MVKHRCDTHTNSRHFWSSYLYGSVVWIRHVTATDVTATDVAAAPRPTYAGGVVHKGNDVVEVVRRQRLHVRQRLAELVVHEEDEQHADTETTTVRCNDDGHVQRRRARATTTVTCNDDRHVQRRRSRATTTVTCDDDGHVTLVGRNVTS